jgi:hypothetical protein
MNEALAAELIAMRDEDFRVRDELARDGSLFHGYHPRMEEVHRRNAARLKQIIAEHGWPGRSLVGEDAARAAWFVVQHSIGDPEFQRSSLELLKQAHARGEMSAIGPAKLEDRIRMFEGRGQLYGTQWDWNESGELAPCEIDDPEHVDERRASVGLDPLAEDIRRQREQYARDPEPPPQDWKQRRREFEEWAKWVGWRK